MNEQANERVLALLDPVFPCAARAVYLRVLLGRGDESPIEKTAATDVVEAWRCWRRLEPSLVDALKAERTDALAATLPFLDDVVTRHGLSLDGDERVRVRTASLRESLRADAYAAVLGPLLERMNASGVEHLVLGGRPLAELLHGNASLHHSGAIDLLVKPRDLEAALHEMRSAGMHDAGRAGDAPWSRWRWLDASGLAVTLATTTLAHPVYRIDEDAVWEQAVAVRSVGRTVAVPALHHQLALLAVRGAWTGASRSLLWLLDAATVLHLGDRLDEGELVESALRGHHALPLLAVLRWLQQTIGVRLEPGIAQGLARAMGEAAAEDEELAFAVAASACDYRSARLVRAALVAGRPTLPLRFGLCPSRSTLEWETGSGLRGSLRGARAARLARACTPARQVP